MTHKYITIPVVFKLENNDDIIDKLALMDCITVDNSMEEVLDVEVSMNHDEETA